jgi:hypothetical protein
MIAGACDTFEMALCEICSLQPKYVVGMLRMCLLIEKECV